jgi:hypothetical protein
MAQMEKNQIQYLIGSRAPSANCPKKGIGDQLLYFLDVFLPDFGGSLCISLRSSFLDSCFGCLYLASNA